MQDSANPPPQEPNLFARALSLSLPLSHAPSWYSTALMWICFFWWPSSEVTRVCTATSNLLRKLKNPTGAPGVGRSMNSRVRANERRSSCDECAGAKH
jgi:hypothetical protein